MTSTNGPGVRSRSSRRCARRWATRSSCSCDANSGFSPQRAIEVGRLLEDNGISHFEEPCPYWELEQTKEVRDALDIDITGGEQDCWLPVWRRMIEMRAVDIVQPDVCYVGGITRTLQRGGHGARRGPAVHPAQRQPSMVTLFTMHLLGAIPTPANILSCRSRGGTTIRGRRVCSPATPMPWTEGMVTIPSEPGWGVEINPVWLEKARYQISEDTNALSARSTCNDPIDHTRRRAR